MPLCCLSNHLPWRKKNRRWSKPRRKAWPPLQNKTQAQRAKLLQNFSGDIESWHHSQKLVSFPTLASSWRTVPSRLSALLITVLLPGESNLKQGWSHISRRTFQRNVLTLESPFSSVQLVFCARQQFRQEPQIHTEINFALKFLLFLFCCCFCCLFACFWLPGLLIWFGGVVWSKHTKTNSQRWIFWVNAFHSDPL